MKEKLSHILLRFYNKTYAVLTDTTPQPHMVLNQKCQEIEDIAISEIMGLIPRWIPVTEKLPPCTGKYLTRVFNNFSNKVKTTELLWYWDDEKKFESDIVFEVTHWQPLPPITGGEVMHTQIMFTCQKCGEQFEALISIDEFEANERNEMILCRDCQREEEIENERNDIWDDDDWTGSNLMGDSD